MKTLLAFLLLSTAAYGQWYSDVDLIAMQIRSPVPWQDWDNYSLSERIQIGYQFEECGLRTRYWHYDDKLDEVGYEVQFDVFDLEATKQVGDFTISGGFRMADWSWSTPPYPDGLGGVVAKTAADATQFGVTIAAEGNTALYHGENWGLAAVYGSRVSLLTGGWSAHGQANTPPKSIGNNGNDTQEVLEASAGLEAKYGCAFWRTELEMQRWESNALTDRGFAAIGFNGIGTTVGVRF